MRFRYRLLVYIVVIGLVIGLYPGMIFGKNSEPFRIGVLMDLSGSIDLDPELVLDWARDLVNGNGGIHGREVELIYVDTGVIDIVTAAEDLLSRDDIQVVIGPETSDNTFKIAPEFIDSQKLLISPTATSVDIFRAFGGQDYLWRTVPGDAAQARTILYILDQRNVEKISLIYQDSAYGQTYLAWLPFFAIEMGIDINLVQFQSGKSGEIIDQALSSDPDYIIVGAFTQEAVEIKQELDRRSSSVPLFLTDGAQTTSLIETLGPAAEGLEGTAPTYNPDSGFREAYIERYGEEPLCNAAAIWDAFYLAVCTLARYEYKAGGEWLEYSIRSVITGKGNNIPWNEIDRAIELIEEGGHPDIDGAAGDLTFDDEYGLDPVQGYYAHWRVGDGTFVTDRTVDLDEITAGTDTQGVSLSRGRTGIDLKPFALLSDDNYEISEDRIGLKAVIVTTTEGWKNYRHQSDALAVYDMLRENGVRDDNIIFFSADDIPLDEMNPLPGVVRHESGGMNLRSGAQIDYSGISVTAKNVLRVLRGEETLETPFVLNADENTDVLVYIAGHGKQGSIPFENGASLSAKELAQALNDVYDHGGFRKMLVMTELCYGESMAAYLDTPGILYLTAASATEQSFGTNYDPEVGTWVADDFSYTALKLVSQHPSMYITDLYSRLYDEISGSHVRIANTRNFGGLRDSLVSDFFSP